MIFLIRGERGFTMFSKDDLEQLEALKEKTASEDLKALIDILISAGKYGMGYFVGDKE